MLSFESCGNEKIPGEQNFSKVGYFLTGLVYRVSLACSIVILVLTASAHQFGLETAEAQQARALQADERYNSR